MAEPNPGSPEVIERGCTCPVIDNHYGAGMPYPRGPCLWVTASCSLHNTHSKWWRESEVPNNA